MNEDFQTIRERVRNGEHLKANIIMLYKWRNILCPIQPWESTAAGQRQNYMAIREKQELIQKCQTAIDRKKATYRKAAWAAISALLLTAIAVLLEEYLHARFFSFSEQTKPPIIQNIQKPTANTPATSTTDKQNKSQSKTE